MCKAGWRWRYMGEALEENGRHWGLWAGGKKEEEEGREDMLKHTVPTWRRVSVRQPIRKRREMEKEGAGEDGEEEKGGEGCQWPFTYNPLRLCVRARKLGAGGTGGGRWCWWCEWWL